MIDLAMAPARETPVAEILPRRGLLSPVLEYEVGGEPYLFVGETNVMLALDPIARTLVTALGRDGASLASAFKEASGTHGDEPARDTLRELLAEGVVWGGEMPETGGDLRLPTAHYANVPIKSVVLNLAQGCNLGCTYCFADEGLYHSKQYAMMAEHVAFEAIDFAFAEGRGHVHVTFFGGEPMMNWPVLAASVDFGEAKAVSEGRTIDFSITTNGSLLTDERIDFLAAHRIGVSVSLDGPPEINDRRRVFPGGKGSSAQVMPRVQRLLDRHRTRPIGCRVTLSAGATDVESIFDYLMGMGFHEVGFAPVTTSNADILLPEDEMLEVLAGFKKLAARTMAAASEGRFLGFANLVNTWQELHEGKTKSHGCGAGLGLLSVGAEGGLYLCHRFTGAKEFQFGSIQEGLDREARVAFLDKANVARKGPCQTCFLKRTCAGGCYHEAWQRMGSAYAPNGHYCDYMRSWMLLAIETYTELAVSNPEYISRYLAPRMRRAPGEGPGTHNKQVSQ